jgi:histidinol-phosphate aminotransferase
MARKKPEPKARKMRRQPLQAKPAHPTVNEIAPYVPGKPAEELARELGLTRIVKLASNENPLGPSPKAAAALAAVVHDIHHRYPDGASFELKRAIAGKLGVPSNMVVLGNGSNEILEVLAQLFLGKGHEAVYAWPAFVVYRLATLAHGARGVEVPLAPGLRHDLPAMAAAVTKKTRLVFVGNPNNPTGTWVTREELVSFLETLPPRALPVLDEAYFEYARDLPGFPDGVELARQGHDLCVLRTFSKVYGLAGLRVGYGVMPEKVAALYEKVRQPFNINRAGQEAALAALGDDDFVRRSVAGNRAGMEWLTRELTALGLPVTPSAGNFLLFSLGARSGKEVFGRLLRRGVIVRPVDNYGLPHHLRVTVGTPGENVVFLEALRASL